MALSLDGQTSTSEPVLFTRPDSYDPECGRSGCNIIVPLRSYFQHRSADELSLCNLEWLADKRLGPATVVSECRLGFGLLYYTA